MTGDFGENFSGETGGVEPRRDDGEDRRFSQRIAKTLDRIGVHDESYHSGLCLPVDVAADFGRIVWSNKRAAGAAL